jgi:hypothetical protein
MYRQSQYNEIP